MTQGPFLLRLCQRGAFTGLQTIFFYLCSFVPKRKAVCDRPRHEWSKPSPTAGKPGRMPYLLSQINLSQQIRHTSLILVCPISRFRHGLLSFFGASFCHRFLLGFFSICLYRRLPPFSRLSVGTHQGGHSRSGRKGNSGIGRESKVKPPVFAKNLQPCG